MIQKFSGLANRAHCRFSLMSLTIMSAYARVYIGVDIGVRFGLGENNSKNFAGCDTRTSHPAIAELRKVQHNDFAPCDSLTSHPATSRYHTLPLSPIAQCGSKRPQFGLVTDSLPPFRRRGAGARTRGGSASRPSRRSSQMRTAPHPPLVERGDVRQTNPWQTWTRQTLLH